MNVHNIHFSTHIYDNAYSINASLHIEILMNNCADFYASITGCALCMRKHLTANTIELVGKKHAECILSDHFTHNGNLFRS